MRIYDISVPVGPGIQVYPGDPHVVREPALRLEAGDGANVTRLSLSSHTGTHIDAPSHMLQNAATLDDVPFSALLGRVLVADLRGISVIGSRDLADLPLQGEERLLLRTDNSGLWPEPGFCSDYAALSVDGADYLVRAGIRLVGIDYLSIERFGGDGSVHRRLLESGIVILEGLDLSGIAAGLYELLCLPLRIEGADGAPARAVLRESPGPSFVIRSGWKQASM